MAKGLQRKESNFYLAYTRKPAKSRAAKQKEKLFLFPIALAVILLAVFAIFEISAVRSAAELRVLKEYTEDSTNQQLIQSAWDLSAEESMWFSERDQLKTMREAFQSYPIFDLNAWMQIAVCMDGTSIQISGFHYDAAMGVLSINGASPSVADAPLFVQNLRMTDLFAAIDYTGYGSDSEGNYTFQVNGLRKIVGENNAEAE